MAAANVQNNQTIAVTFPQNVVSGYGLGVAINAVAPIKHKNTIKIIPNCLFLISVLDLANRKIPLGAKNIARIKTKVKYLFIWILLVPL